MSDTWEYFEEICAEYVNKIVFLPDKPEETLQSTLKALWLKAYGIQVSAEKAIHMELPKLNESQRSIFLELINLRVQKTPLAYLTERQTFMGIDFKVDKRALIPRKETELLGKKSLELSLQNAKESQSVNCMDVCCGSGNLGISIAQLNSDCIVYSSDISEEAVELTRENIEMQNLTERVKAQVSDLLSAFEDEKFYSRMDVIMCNPPYISSNKIKSLESEISWNEPDLAFDGGPFGIKIIQRLIQESPKFLKVGGWLTFEVGIGQGPFFIQICQRSGQFDSIESVSDNESQIRVIAARRKKYY